jgi:hypothetical protein
MLEHIGFSEKLKVLGDIAEISYIKGTVTLLDGDGNQHQTDLEDVILLERVGVLGDAIIFDRDVLISTKGEYFEVELQENRKDIEVHLLDDNFKRITGKVDNFDKETFHMLDGYVELVGNIFEIEATVGAFDYEEGLEEEEGFPNVDVVKEFNGTHFTYYYACNNKDAEAIDLFPLTFLDEYHRISLSYAVYQDCVEAKTFVQVSEQELKNYLYGLEETSDVPTERVVEELEGYVVTDEEELEEYCAECDEPVKDCDCKGW